MDDISCKRCTNCCTDTIIPINDDEMKKLMRATGLPMNKIVRFYSFDEVHWPKDSEDWVELRAGRRLMALRQKKDRCMFLSPQGCVIYKSRPRVCRLFPVDFYFTEDFDGHEVEIQSRIHGCEAGVKNLPKNGDKLYQIGLSLFKKDLAYQKKVAGWNDENPRGTAAEFLAFLKLM